VLIPQIVGVTLPSLQFEAATIVNIDSDLRFGPATHEFYNRIFSLYNAAPGASSALDGNFVDSGCGEFTGLGKDPTGTPIPCARHFYSVRGLPSKDTLTSGRVDWNASRNDRVFLQVQNDRGYLAAYVDPINPLFDADGHFPWWQGQIVETHTLGSSAASQFLLAGTYNAPIYELAHGAQALAAFPATLEFNASGTFTSLAGANSGLASPAEEGLVQS